MPANSLTLNCACEDSVEVLNSDENCGIGSDGFQPGNTCAKGKGLHGKDRETDIGEDAYNSLLSQIESVEKKTDWSKLPADFKSGAVKKLKEALQPHFRGKANNEIRARAALSKAEDFEEVKSALLKLRVIRDAPTQNELHVVSNLSGKTRREKHGGREYLVKPMTMIVSGVLNGSRGPLYYPPEEVGRNPKIWDGMPILVYHPKNGRSGRDPLVANEQEIGRVYNTGYKDNRLTAEGWFDIELTKRIDNRVYDALVSNKMMELSTGLFADYDETPGTHNGIQYTTIVRNIGADHLAILPDQKGACSLADGCGVMNQSQNKSLLQRLKEFLHLVENEEMTENTEEDSEIENVFCETGEGGGVDPTCGKDGSSGGASKSTKPKKAPKEPSVMSAAEINKELDKLSETRSKITDEFIEGGRGHERPTDYADKTDDLSVRAQQVEKRHGELRYEIERRYGPNAPSRLPKGFGPIRNESTETDDSLSSTNNEDSHTGLSTSTQEGGAGMAKLTDAERKDRIDKLVKNEAWKDHRKVLEGFKDEQLLTLNCGEMMKKPGEEVPVNTEEEEQVVEDPKKKFPPTQNAEKKTRMSFSEIMEVADDDFRDFVHNSIREQNAKKQELIEVIIANESNEYTENELKAMKPDQLRKLGKIAASQVKVQNHQDFHSYASYIGAASAPIENVSHKLTEAEKKDTIPVMNIDYEEISRSHNSKHYRSDD